MLNDEFWSSIRAQWSPNDELRVRYTDHSYYGIFLVRSVGSVGLHATVRNRASVQLLHRYELKPVERPYAVDEFDAGSQIDRGIVRGHPDTDLGAAAAKCWGTAAIARSRAIRGTEDADGL
jgi:hypothetical protein